MQTEPEKLANEKKPYQTPKLIKHGTVEEITGDVDDCVGVGSGFTCGPV